MEKTEHSFGKQLNDLRDHLKRLDTMPEKGWDE